MDRGAPQDSALGVEQVAVDGLGAKQPGNLVDQALEDGVQLQLARDHLRGLEQRALLAEPALVLLQQPGRVDCEPDLVRDGFGDRDVSVGPRARSGVVQAKHADHPVEDDHRRREDGARAEPVQDLAPAEERVFELRRVAHVGDRDRASLAGREVGGRQALDRFLADRRETLGEPLRPHRQPLARLTEPQEAARGTEGAARLGDGHARDGVEIVHGTDAPRDLGHQSLAREGLVQGRRRSRPVERDCRLACDRLHQPELLRRERAPLARRRKDEHAGHPLVDGERHERGALRAGRLRQAAADERRRLYVVHRDRRRVEVRARDPRRLVHEVDPHLGPPLDVFAAAPRHEAVGLAAVLADQRERREVDAQQCDDFVEQRPPDRDRFMHPRQRARKRGDGVELAIAQRNELFGLTRASPAQEEIRPFVPARQADERRRDEPDQAGCERRPDVTADRRAINKDDDSEDRRRDSDPGKHERDRDVGQARAAALAPERRSQHGRDQEVRRRQDEQRNGVEIDSLVLGGHWAPLMIRSAAHAVENTRFVSGKRAPCGFQR